MTNNHRRVAVVAGAGRRRSIGRGIAEHLVGEGYRVVASDIGAALRSHPDYEVAPLDDLNALAAGYDPRDLTTHRCDVTDETQLAALFAFAESTYGRVDVAVNSTGLGIGLTPTVELSLADWKVNLEVMATGAFLFARQAARTMVASGGTDGRIITIGSRTGKTAVPNLAAYSSAKFAVNALTQSMASELGHYGITVNAVCPGSIDTNLLAVKNGMFDTFSRPLGISDADALVDAASNVPVGRMGTPHDIAVAVAYLAAPQASFVTGSTLNVAGGEEFH